MFFNSFEFLLFLAIVLLLLLTVQSVGRNVRIRNMILLASSYIFYGWFNIDFLLILFYVTVVNYIAGNLISRRRYARQTVAAAVVLSLLPLSFFKYTFFLLDSLRSLMRLEIDLTVIDGLILPVGISFFTFQALSYTIDLYRGKISKTAGLLDFSLFVAFFPTILSGPIEKARDLLPQFGTCRKIVPADVIEGACIFIWGVFKKIVIADRLAEYVDYAYGSSEYVSGLTLAVAAVFYSIQIYCDFSGYSDMALGVAKILGFDITKNFRQPYFSKTIKEFWRKWHIALTSWFTEYVYFSLGGNRVRTEIRWVFNISMVFLLSGIWHGASWNFIIWGALHAVFYLIEHYAGLQKTDIRWNGPARVLSGVLVFVLVTIAWVFFRLPSFDDSIYVIGKMICDIGGRLSMGASTFTFAGTVAMLAVFIVYELCLRKGVIVFDIRDYRSRLTYNMMSCVVLLLFMALFGRSSDTFVYFQF